MKKRKQHSVRVELSYSLDDYMHTRWEEDLIAIAKKCKFKMTGSGAGFGERDISFESTTATAAQAEKFVKIVRQNIGKSFLIRAEIIETTAHIGESYYI